MESLTPQSAGVGPGSSHGEMLEVRRLLSAVVTHYAVDLPLPRTGMEVVAVAGKVLFAGGFTKTPLAESNEVDVWDTVRGGFSNTTLPNDALLQAVGQGRSVYFRSAQDGQTDAYDVVTGTWSQRAIAPGTTRLMRVVDNLFAVHTKQSGVHFHVSYDGFPPTLSIPTSLDSGDFDTVLGATVVTHPGRLELFDTISGLGENLPGPAFERDQPAIVPMGNKILFFDAHNGTAPAEAWMFDVITQHGQSISVPSNLRIRAGTGGFAALGTKVIFGDGAVTRTGKKNAQAAVIYDSATDEWSTTSTTGGSASAVLGNQAFFGNGSSGAMDVYTDLTLAPVISGSVHVDRHGVAGVTLENDGDAPLVGPYTIRVFALPVGAKSGGVLMGAVGRSATLSPGQAESGYPVFLDLAIPLARGRYHFVATVTDANGVTTPVAADFAEFQVRRSTVTTATAKAIRSTATTEQTIVPQQPSVGEQETESVWRRWFGL